MDAISGGLIIRTPGVLGGRARVDGTRIAVRTIAILYTQGLSSKGIAGQYPQLSQAQVDAALSYYHANQSEIDADIAAEQMEYERLAREHNPTRKSA